MAVSSKMASSPKPVPSGARTGYPGPIPASGRSPDTFDVAHQDHGIGPGYPSLRFDLSGIGDSAPRADALAPVEAALADIREALDSLQAARKARRVILAGLCSGADFSILYAASDPRVVGLVLMDPSIPRTSRFHVHRFLSRISRARSWLNVIQGRHPVWGILKEKVALGTEQAASVADRAEAALDRESSRRPGGRDRTAGRLPARR